MSMPYEDYYCSQCNFKSASFVLWGRFTYKSSLGEVPVNRCLGWCYSCKGLVPMEEFPSRAHIEELITNISKTTKQISNWKLQKNISNNIFRKLINYFTKMPDEIHRICNNRLYLIEELKDELDRKNILAIRHSGPRCLICGSYNCKAVTGPKSSDKLHRRENELLLGMKHPDCGGDLLFKHSGIRAGVRLYYRFYDIDGGLLETVDERECNRNYSKNINIKEYRKDLNAKEKEKEILCKTLLPIFRSKYPKYNHLTDKKVLKKGVFSQPSG